MTAMLRAGPGPVALLLAALGTFLGAEAVAAQAPVDFSGHWTATVGGGPGGGSESAESGWGSEFTLMQRADSLMVERMFFSPGDLQPPLRFRYALDGSETRNVVMVGRGMQAQIASARWQGESLVIVVRHVDPSADEGRGVTAEVRHVLSYEPTFREAHPPVLVIETTRQGILGGRSSTTRTVYTRG
jgi:hypothetical protein